MKLSKLLPVIAVALASAAQAQQNLAARFDGIPLQDRPEVLLMPGAGDANQTLGILQYLHPQPDTAKDGRVAAVATLWKPDCAHTSLMRLDPAGYVFAPDRVGPGLGHAVDGHDSLTQVDPLILQAAITQVCADKHLRQLYD